MKTILFFLVVIAIGGFLVYRYFEEENCPKSPITKQCIGTTTGYEQLPPSGGGGAPVEVSIP